MAAFPVTTFLFTDVEGSTRLWEAEPQRMRAALAAHDAIARRAVEAFRGTVVKMTGDGMHAAFGDALDALCATLELQQALADPGATGGLALRVRCGLHEGAEEARDNDFFGPAVNRAARIMAAAHGGQVLVSRALADRLRGRLPARVELRDLGLARLRDLTDPEQIFQVVDPRLRQDFPALRSLEATPNNLPQQVTSFVGRERILQDVRQWLSTTRLLTLTGAGGLGKTRLALQLAAEVVDEYLDGVWFVDLAPLADGSMVAPAVASVLGVREEGGSSLSETLAAHLRERQSLVVFDNCEHLVQTCAQLAATLLHAASKLKVLATSREALHVRGETIYAVPTLAAPDAHSAQSVAELGALESVRLFAERACAAQPEFRLTERNAATVAGICRHLDGIPLAIELAAARVRSLSVESVAERLSDRFRLLKGGDRDVLPRQQSLRALIDWSYDLLTEPERAVLRRLSIFAGGWTLEAAEAVCAEGAVPAEDVIDLLVFLVDKSLVILEADRARYRMLETLRQYARERLEETGEKKAARQRHLAYFLAFAEKARPALVGPQQGAWLARLDAERENLVAAHRACDRAVDGAQSGLRLLDSVKLYWFMHGQLGLGLRLMREALERPAARERNAARCRGLFGAGQICSFTGRYDEAVTLLKESLAIARETADERNELAALQPLALALQGLGELEKARAHGARAVELARKFDTAVQLVGALTIMAQLHRAQGELDAAEPIYEEVLSLARASGDRENVAIGLLNLAMVATDRGVHDRARKSLREALSIAQEIGSIRSAQSVVEVCAGLAAASGAWADAARFFGAAEAHALLSGLKRDASDEAFLMCWIERAKMGFSAEAFGRAESAGRSLGQADALAEVAAWLAAERRPTD